MRGVRTTNTSLLIRDVVHILSCQLPPMPPPPPAAPRTGSGGMLIVPCMRLSVARTCATPARRCPLHPHAPHPHRASGRHPCRTAALIIWGGAPARVPDAFAGAWPSASFWPGGWSHRPAHSHLGRSPQGRQGATARVAPPMQCGQGGMPIAVDQGVPHPAEIGCCRAVFHLFCSQLRRSIFHLRALRE